MFQARQIYRSKDGATLLKGEHSLEKVWERNGQAARAALCPCFVHAPRVACARTKPWPVGLLLWSSRFGRHQRPCSPASLSPSHGKNVHPATAGCFPHSSTPCRPPLPHASHARRDGQRPALVRLAGQRRQQKRRVGPPFSGERVVPEHTVWGGSVFGAEHVPQQGPRSAGSGCQL